ncbi:hypothetical protein FLM9_664 [Candidatus Synechococcus spongiarum]|uniref:Uncharacterized protein n=1 Tax=Candidatus Synechococcus spongiarum TaxID=431041 RepID=A0A161KA82_9SYNE|nr:hypothetical protein FLM9_664 [Candidatus Synechococcus spongiarum]
MDRLQPFLRLRWTETTECMGSRRLKHCTQFRQASHQWHH